MAASALNDGWPSRCAGDAAISDACLVRCVPGFSRWSGNAQRQCQANGLWNGRPMQVSTGSVGTPHSTPT